MIYEYVKFIAATLRVAGSLAKSTEVMQAMQRLVRIPEVAQTMQDMSKEMMKAGIIEEMLDETFEDMEDQEELEDAAQVEVCILFYLIFYSLLLFIKKNVMWGGCKAVCS